MASPGNQYRTNMELIWKYLPNGYHDNRFMNCMFKFMPKDPWNKEASG